MNNICELDKKDCTGCRMCEQICPVNAVTMKENKEGFIEPVINKEKCINCGLCFERCPQLNSLSNNGLDKVEVYAAKNNNVEVQRCSSSGGIFFALAEYVLKNNGVIYGCAFNKDIVAEHMRIDNIDDLVKLRGSKYVQSDTKDTFKTVKMDLNDKKFVLYSGTPCQIAGLRLFLGKKYENLITVDLVCHGVPSPKLFKKYKEWLEKRYNSKIVNYEFRNKEKNGWGLTSKIVFENGKTKFLDSRLDPYYKTFLDSITYRESCYNCKYANTNRISDITLADYWGIEKEHSEFYDKFGVSAVIINTFKGKKIITEIGQCISLRYSELNKVISRNSNLIQSSERKNIRDNIYKMIDDMDFDEYSKRELKFKVNKKDFVKNLVPSTLKSFIRKILREFYN